MRTILSSLGIAIGITSVILLTSIGQGLHQFIIWGVLAGIFNSIPYLGPLLVTGVEEVGRDRMAEGVACQPPW